LPFVEEPQKTVCAEAPAQSIDMSSAIRTEGLTKRFRKVSALAGLGLSVIEGSVHALVGPKGAGKTTLIKILMNIFRASSGRATVLGIDSTKISGKAFATIGYVSENQQLPGWMRVGGFLSYLRPLSNLGPWT
jgi:ABC-2 type transport system ATP-binding protein